jgi:DNA-binding transcriptional regulator YiaG
MPNIANVLKAEITRLARKELREGSDALRKTVVAQREAIAGLRRRVQDLEASIKRLERAQSPGRVRERAVAAPAAAGEGSSAHRFSAKGLASNRKKLGLSAADYGLLIGTSGASIYLWESGKTTPRPQTLAAIAALRGVGKREVDARLAKLKA